jgi:flagellar biosynthesis protein FlhB
MPDDNKTEQATSKKRGEARKQGQIARSRELPSLLAMTGATAALCFMSRDAVTHWTTFYRMTLASAANSDLDSNGPVIFWSAVEVFRWIIPILFSALILSVSAGLAQGELSH